MKKIIFLLAFVISAGAYAQSFQSKAYKTGNYIFCGKELPKHFSYTIEKKGPGDNNWNVVAALKSPKNEAECKAAFMDLPLAIAAITEIKDSRIHKCWTMSQPAMVIDSLYALAFDPCYQAALGCAWFDDGLTLNGDYRYRISKVLPNGDKTLLNEVTVNYPGTPYSGTLRAARFRLNTGIVSISYEIKDSLNTAGLKVFRSGYKENKFTEITPEIYFTMEEHKTVAIVNDYSAIKEVTYSYVAIPYDVLGNMGKATTDTLNIYNFTKASDLGIIEKFDATANPEKKGVELKWKLANTSNVTSVDIYRSDTYDGRYDKIISMPSNATEYFDSRELKPATAYYYYILINNGYGKSLPSARTPAILKGTKLNILPPQNLTLAKYDRIVTLTFRRLDSDTRGYYVYRANGYVSPLTQLPLMLLSSDSVLTYNDTLPLSAHPAVYTYAVASINTSYNISPLTERVSVKYSGGMLPVPSKVNAVRFNNTVFVSWDNVSEQHAGVSSYRVYRSIVNAEGRETVSDQLLATTTFEENSFSDSAIADGVHYRYRIQCMGSDSTDVGSMSLPAGINIPEQLPLQPGSIAVYASDKAIVISWDLPDDPSVSSIRIYRALVGTEATLLKELPVESSQFEDATATRGLTYYYYIQTMNKSGKASEPTDAVSGKLL